MLCNWHKSRVSTRRYWWSLFSYYSKKIFLQKNTSFHADCIRFWFVFFYCFCENMYIVFGCMYYSFVHIQRVWFIQKRWTIRIVSIFFVIASLFSLFMLYGYFLMLCPWFLRQRDRDEVGQVTHLFVMKRKKLYHREMCQ